jgi:hypothetical protein
MLPALMGSAGPSGSDLFDLVAGCVVEAVDEGVDDVDEHHLVAGPVQDQPDEAAADVARAEVDGDAAHAWLTAFRRS